MFIEFDLYIKTKDLKIQLMLNMDNVKMIRFYTNLVGKDIITYKVAFDDFSLPFSSKREYEAFNHGLRWVLDKDTWYHHKSPDYDLEGTLFAIRQGIE